MGHVPAAVSAECLGPGGAATFAGSPPAAKVSRVLPPGALAWDPFEFGCWGDGGRAQAPRPPQPPAVLCEHSVPRLRTSPPEKPGQPLHLDPRVQNDEHGPPLPGSASLPLQPWTVLSLSLSRANVHPYLSQFPKRIPNLPDEGTRCRGAQPLAGPTRTQPSAATTPEVTAPGAKDQGARNANTRPPNMVRHKS